MQDRTLVAVATGDGALCVFDATTGLPLRHYHGHTAEVLSLDVSAKGRFLLTASADGTARLWDLHSHVVEPAVPHSGGVAVRSANFVLIALLLDLRCRGCGPAQPCGGADVATFG